MKQITYVPKSYHIFVLLLVILCWMLGLGFLSTIISITYLVLFLLFRKKKLNYKETEVTTKGLVFSPVNGTLKFIEEVEEHPVFGHNLKRLLVMVPWWREYGLYMPLTSEVLSLNNQKGQSLWRFSQSKSLDSQKNFECDQVVFTSPDETKIGVEIFKCVAGGFPQLWVLPGDRGKRQVQMGYLPFGGTVAIYLPKEVEINVKINDKVSAGESILAAMRQ